MPDSGSTYRQHCSQVDTQKRTHSCCCGCWGSCKRVTTRELWGCKHVAAALTRSVPGMRRLLVYGLLSLPLARKEPRPEDASPSLLLQAYCQLGAGPINPQEQPVPNPSACCVGAPCQACNGWHKGCQGNMRKLPRRERYSQTAEVCHCLCTARHKIQWVHKSYRHTRNTSTLNSQIVAFLGVKHGRRKV